MVSACVIIPSFNHGPTLPRVARAAAAHAPVIIVDDGSTDETRAMTEAALHGKHNVTILRHERNEGKGVALRSGFHRAREAGFTHAVTLDADGQHDADAIPGFITAAAKRPEAVHLGVRDLKAEGAPTPRRAANSFSNFWFRAETGLRVADTQCGFRAYPVEAALALHARGRGYDFELEVLVHAAWAGIEIIPIPVRARYGTGDIGPSHFRPLRDFLSISRLNFRLMTQRIICPAGMRARIAGRAR